MIEAWFDGSVIPHNPGGHGGYGAIVCRQGQTLFSEAGYIGRWPNLSNNVAEYAGVITILRFLLHQEITEGTIYGDANLITNQLNGNWRARRGAYIPYYQEAYALRVRLPQIVIKWIPRELNFTADDLAQAGVMQRHVLFSLDPLVKPILPPKRAERHSESRAVRQAMLNVREDEAWEMFKTRYGDL